MGMREEKTESPWYGRETENGERAQTVHRHIGKGENVEQEMERETKTLVGR